MSRSGVVPGEYTCASCGEPSTVFVDLSGGYDQVLIEDCEVCCRPNRIQISVDEDTEELSVWADHAG